MNKQDTRRLLQKYREGRCTPEERSWAEQWYLEMAGKQQAAEADIENRRSGTWKQIRRIIVKEKKRDWHPLVAAASAVLVLGLLFLVYRNSDIHRVLIANAVQYSTEVTRNGDLRKLALPDGSEVWLNAGSSLRYSDQFGQELREVFLDDHKDSIYVVLDRVQKDYALTRSRNAPKADEAVQEVIAASKH